jgi:hypothetical protein
VAATAPLSYNSGTQTLSIDLTAYETASHAAATYYPLTNPAGYLTSAALSGYATQSWVTSGFYPLASNPAGYLQSGALTGYATQSWVTSQGYLLSSTAASTYLAKAGGDMTANATVQFSDTNNDSQIAGWGFGVELSADPTQNASLSFNALTVQDGLGTTQVTASGLTFPDASTQTTGFPGYTGTSAEYIAGDGSLITFPTLATANKLTATVYNQTGATLTKGQVVYINGAHGNLPTVTLSQANSESTSAGTYGLVAANIGNMSSGTIVIAGVIENLATNSYADGDKLYLSPTVAGGYTTTKPSAPNHMVYVGVVTRAHPTQGTIQLRIANGFEVEELHDAAISSPTNNDLFVYESATSLWKNKSFSTLGLATQSWVTSQGYLTSSALTGYATLASPTFTGDPKAPTPSTGDNDTSIATTAFVKNQGYLTSSSLTAYALKVGSDAIQVTGNTIKSFDGSDNFAALDQGALNFGNGSTPSGIVINGSSITFADATVQTTAATGGIPDAPSDGNTYGRNNGAWVIAGGGSGSGTLTYSSGQLYDTSTANFVSDLNLSNALTADVVTGGNNATLNSSGLTLAASSGAVITFADATTQSTAAVGIPSGGTTGQVLAKNSATDYDVSWVAAGGGGGGGHGVNIQTFGSSTTSGTFTWTKPTHAKWVEIYLVGGGGGGGSGARQATTSIRGGGGGGGGAPILYSRIGADALGSTETVVVGAGGVGAIAVATNSTNGNSASVATATTFANFRSGLGNPGGGGGSTTGGTAGGGGNGILFSAVTSSGSGAAGATGGASNASGTTGSFINPQGGGGGAGASASSTANASGGSGGPFSASTSAGNSASIAGGSAGTSAGVAATAGTNATTRLMQAGTGGGGGFYRTGVAGGTGGNGGWPGGGAGGGGASDNGFASGAGGNGGNGFALIITYT